MKHLTAALLLAALTLTAVSFAFPAGGGLYLLAVIFGLFGAMSAAFDIARAGQVQS